MTALRKDGQDWWKIEPKYSTKVLIGNWLEERKRFYIKDTVKLGGSSIYRTDFISFPDHKPDQTLRRTMLEKSEGLPMQHFFTHHEEPRSRNLVSEYDDKYNRHGYNPVLPPLCIWNGHKSAWIPQKSDFPILEPPTNYGLLEHLMRKWHEKEAGVMNSVYTISYESPPTSAFATCQLRHPAETHGLPSIQGHFPKRLLESWTMKEVRNICKPSANCLDTVQTQEILTFDWNGGTVLERQNTPNILKRIMSEEEESLKMMIPFEQIH